MSGKNQGILKWMISGNPVRVIAEISFQILYQNHLPLHLMVLEGGMLNVSVSIFVSSAVFEENVEVLS